MVMHAASMLNALIMSPPGLNGLGTSLAWATWGPGWGCVNRGPRFPPREQGAASRAPAAGEAAHGRILLWQASFTSSSAESVTVHGGITELSSPSPDLGRPHDGPGH